MADTTTTTYGLTKPEVGASEDTWGTKLNTNLDTIDDLLDGTTAIAPNLTAGSWKVGGTAITATAAEINLLDGVTATTAELNYVDGVTSNVQTQLDTLDTDKADLASPTFTGTPAAPTAATSTDTTQIATTEFVQAVKAVTLSAIYPVGSIYTNATNSTNPATLLGFGTWSRFGKGKVLVSQDSTNTLFDTAEETGGSYDAVVVSHTHSITDPGHNHSIPVRANSGGGSYVEDANSSNFVTSTTGTSTTGISINSAGESGTNKNIQPYITVYMWKRTA